MSRGDPLQGRDYLEHIAEAIANIRDYTAGMDAAAYLADRKTQDAVVRNFEVIGEACNSVVKHHAAFARMAIFKLHAPLNNIVGGGVFAYATNLPLSLAWESFGVANGATTLTEMRRRIIKYRRAGLDDRSDFPIGVPHSDAAAFLRRT